MIATDDIDMDDLPLLISDCFYYRFVHSNDKLVFQSRDGGKHWERRRSVRHPRTSEYRQSHLDKQINKFYNCISKTHQDPPSIQIVDNCYSQNSIAGITGPGSITTTITITITLKPILQVIQGLLPHLPVFW